MYVKYFTWVTDLSSVDLFVVLRLVKEMFPIISVQFGPPRNINCIWQKYVQRLEVDLNRI